MEEDPGRPADGAGGVSGLEHLISTMPDMGDRPDKKPPPLHEVIRCLWMSKAG